jgi:hypothetical protein
MLAGGSVGGGWDQLERAGPKDDRQVTRSSKSGETGQDNGSDTGRDHGGSKSWAGP